MNQPSIPRKALADLYLAYPWLKDITSSLEAQISKLTAQRAVLDQDFEDLNEENDEMADTILKQSHDLRLAHADFASLASRYEVLIDAMVKLTQGKSKDE